MPPEVAEAADDIRSQLASAMAAQEPEEIEAVADKPAEEKPEVVEEAKEAAEDKTEEAKAEESKAEEPEDEKAEDKSEPDKVEAPSNWSKRDKEMLARIDDKDVAKWLLERDKAWQADYTRKTQATAQLKKDYEPVDQLFQPHRELMKQRGLTPSGLVEAWMNVEKKLASGEESAIEVVRGLVGGYKIPVDKLAAALGISQAKAEEIQTGEQPAQPAPKTVVPPELQQRLDEIERWKRDQDQQKLTLAQRQAIEAENRAQASIEAFKEETDGRGNLLHPHFDEVEADMLAIVQGLKASGKQVPPLKDLYERAVYANPETRGKVLTALQQQEAAKRAQAAKDKAANARRAGSSVTGSPSGPGMSAQRQQDRPLRAELEAAFQDNAA